MERLVVNCETGTTELVPLTEMEIAELAQKEIESAWNSLRLIRNAKLAACDWTVLADTPTSTAAWKAYRQEPRDLPANTTDPLNPVWPTPPA